MSKYIQAIQQKGIPQDKFSKKIKEEIANYQEAEGDLQKLEASKEGKNTVEKQEIDKQIKELKDTLLLGDDYLVELINKFDLVKYEKLSANAKKMGESRKGATSKKAATKPEQQQQQQQAPQQNPAPANHEQQQAPSEAAPTEEAKKSGGVTAGKVVAGLAAGAILYLGVAWNKELWPFNKL